MDTIPSADGRRALLNGHDEIDSSDLTLSSPANSMGSSPNGSNYDEPSAPPLSNWRIAAFGMGHVLNDLCAACWFSYLLVLMHKVLGFESWKAGVILLSGQLADALATPFVGIFSDKSKGLSCGSFYFGRRHLWYLIGTILVIVNFFFLFARCVMCDLTGDDQMNSDANLFYYAFAAAVFNVGWAAVQVSHMALVPEMTANTHARVMLNSVRYAGTVASNLFVFLLLGLLIHVWNMSEVSQFHTLAYVSLGLGTATSLWFLLGTEEPRPKEQQLEYEERMRRRRRNKLPMAAHAQEAYMPLGVGEEDNGADEVIQSASFRAVALGGDAAADLNTSPRAKGLEYLITNIEAGSVPQPEDSPITTGPRGVSLMPEAAAELGVHGDEFENTLARQLYALPIRFLSYRCWLRMPEFWVCAWIYMCSRLVVNVSQVFLPFYSLDVLKLDTIYITILPCVMYVSSMVAAGVMGRINHRFGLKNVFMVGCLQVVVGLGAMVFLPEDRPWCWFVYPCCVLVGFGNGIVMVCATQLTSDLIGSRTNYAAFVFGSFSFTDKLSNGILLFALQSYNDDSSTYVRYVVTLPAIASALGCMVGLLKVDLDEWKRKHTLPGSDCSEQKDKEKETINNKA